MSGQWIAKNEDIQAYAAELKQRGHTLQQIAAQVQKRWGLTEPPHISTIIRTIQRHNKKQEVKTA